MLLMHRIILFSPLRKFLLKREHLLLPYFPPKSHPQSVQSFAFPRQYPEQNLVDGLCPPRRPPAPSTRGSSKAMFSIQEPFPPLLRVVKDRLAASRQERSHR